MRHETVPDDRVEGLGMRRHVLGIHRRNHDHVIADLLGVAAIAPDHAEDYLYSAFEIHEIKDRPYADHAQQVLAACQGFVGRSKALAALRSQSKEGRTLSEANRQKLAGLLEALNSVAKEIDDLLVATAKPEPEKVIPLDYLERKLRASGLLLAVLSH